MIKIENIETLYSPGDANYSEDGHLAKPPFFVVIDGCSAPYNHMHPPILFNGITGGQMVRNIILKTFCSATPDLSLETLAAQANKEIGEKQKSETHLAGASFVLGKINENNIEILQGGDCYALWVTKTGKIKITKNQAYEPEIVLVNNFAQLMKKFNGDRTRAWEEHFPLLAEMKQKNSNKIYAELNGQPEVKECWQKIEIPVSDLKLLICFTDGLIPFDQMGNEEKLAKEIVELYISGYFGENGLNAILSWTRETEEKNAEHSHEDHAEATGLAIRFV